jgi:NAD(P)-dependent dehydrogenase (short-subunit alcohol dehydrogenase family)
MRELSGRVALVTGAASGIGLALAERFAAQGMKLVLADVEEKPLAAAKAALEAQGAAAIAVRTDVMHEDEVAKLADAAYDAFGAVHVLCNNAGVGGNLAGEGTWAVELDDWRWVLGVNLWGVIHGVSHFVPRMLAGGDEGHIVNTASVAGFVTGGTGAPYTVSKHGVVALSEHLYKDLKGRGAKLSASVLCPGWVDTRIIESARNHPDAQKRKGPDPARVTPEQLARLEAVRGFLKAGFRAAEIADAVLEAVRSDRFYVIPVQPEIADAMALRQEDIRLRRNPTLPPAAPPRRGPA